MWMDHGIIRECSHQLILEEVVVYHGVHCRDSHR